MALQDERDRIMAKKIKTIDDLTPDAANLNKGTERGRYLLETSVSRLGLGRSVLADKNGTLIAGNKTTEVAGELGMSKVRVIETDGTELIVVQRTDLDMTDPDDPRARQLAFADNQVGAQNLAWDAQALLTAAQADDLSDFVRDDELKAMIESAQEEESNTGGNDNVDAEPQIDKAEELRVKWGVELGQLWELGDHRLLCGDSTKKEDVANLMRGDKTELLLTDPPYGIGIAANPVRQKYAKSDWDSKPIQPLPFINLCESAVVWGGNYFDLPPAKGFFIWDKKQPEEFTLAMCEMAWTNIDTPAKIFRKSVTSYNKQHPTQKPVELLAWCMQWSKGTVFDPFSGSGTTIIACEQLGRKCRAIEISPAYVAVALQRWADATGKTPKLLQ